MSNLLEIRNISKSFDNKVVLKDVTFNVPAGSIVGFIGDNGAGKSTTFKTVLGLISKDGGTIKIFGEENINKHAKIKGKIGVVFDAMNLPANLTIKQLNKVFKNLFDSWDQDNFYRLVNTFSLPDCFKVRRRGVHKMTPLLTLRLIYPAHNEVKRFSPCPNLLEREKERDD